MDRSQTAPTMKHGKPVPHAVHRRLSRSTHDRRVQYAGKRRMSSYFGYVNGVWHGPCFFFGIRPCVNDNETFAQIMNRLLISLTLFGVLALPGLNSSTYAAEHLQGLDLGREVFLTYCSGCHGFDGLAFYPPAPSFAMGDRLVKSDAELLRSILNGKGAMPWWEGKLPRPWLEQALAYIRHMAQQEDVNVPGDWDGSYYIFAPPGTDPTMDSVDWRIP